MPLPEIKEQVFKLSMSDRLALVTFIIESLQGELSHQLEQTGQSEQPNIHIPSTSIKGNLRAERTTLIAQIRGFLKTDKPAPTDTEVDSMLEERLLEKYLQ